MKGSPSSAAARAARRDVVIKVIVESAYLLTLGTDRGEQAIAAAPLVTELLGACPAMKALVTSRELLHVAGEHAFADGAGHLDAVKASGRTPILALWHGRILPATLYFRDRGVVALDGAAKELLSMIDTIDEMWKSTGGLEKTRVNGRPS